MEAREAMQGNILIVDDEVMLRNMVANYLRRLGYSIRRAANMETARQLMEKEEFAVVVTDRNMTTAEGRPDGGVLLLRHIKRHFPKTTVLMMTGYATVETALEAMREGAVDFLPKPLDPEDLHRRISRILRCKSNLDPQQSIRIFEAVNQKVLRILEHHDGLDSDELREELGQLGESIDSFVKAKQDLEQIIARQQESLGRISNLATQLQSMLDLESLESSLLKGILNESREEPQHG